ncbi:MAG: HD-GYP domain-containing protein [Clostridium sp.]|uniref:HD-GYP domain-containing protein n=1 Tax=Clostridium sp. TaxID=1506 RepID=UPI003026D550
MKLTLLKDLKGHEILGKDIITAYGKVLLKKGIVITSDIKRKIEQQGIFFIYVEHDDLKDIKDDTELINLKKNVLQTLPNMFKDLIGCDEKSIKKSITVLDDLVDYVQNENYINLNLYEVKLYDDYTYIHSVDTSIMSIFLGVNMNYSKERLRELAVASLFHDIGKTRISNEIINKPSELSDEEFKEIKKHPEYGMEILKNNPMVSDEIISGVISHHEKYDGNGYPFKLKGDEISEFAKIISVCDVFTAITSDRSYRKKFDPREAYELILAETYRSFDPEIIKLFKETFAVYPLGCPVRLSNNLFGYVVNQNKGYPDRPIIRIVKNEINNKVTPYDINLKDIINVVIVNTMDE